MRASAAAARSACGPRPTASPPSTTSAPELRSSLDPCREGLHDLAEELFRLVALERAVVVEHLADAADIGFGLLQHGHVEEHERLAQVVVGAEAADGSG